MSAVRVRLADVASIGAPLVDPRLVEYSGLNLINGENIETGTGRVTFTRTAAHESAVSPKYLFGPGDVLYSKLRPYLRKVTVAPGRGLCSADMYPLRVDATRVDPHWLMWYLLAPPFTEFAVRESGRARMPKLNREQLLSHLLPLPPLDEQRRIAARLRDRLREVEALSRVLGATVQAIESERTTLMRSAVIGATVPRRISRLSDVAAVQLGKMMSPAARRGRNPLPYIRNANVQWDRFDLAHVGTMDFDDREESKFELRSGDVLVCEGGEPGRAAVWRSQIARCGYQKALHRVRPHPDQLDPQFLVYRLWLGAVDGEFAAANATTTIAHLPAVRLKGLQLSLPSIGDQRRIVARLRQQLEEIDDAWAALEARREVVEALPAALLREEFGFAGAGAA